MKKMKKVLSIFLCALLITSVCLVSSFAADPQDAVSMVVKTPPTRTVFYDGMDNLLVPSEITDVPVGAVLTITYKDGTEEDITVAEDTPAVLDIDNFTIGENTAEIRYFFLDEDGNVVKALSADLPVTVEESPVASVEITKLPNKLVYDLDKDVITRENVTLDGLYAANSKLMDAIFESVGMNFEDYKASITEDPEQLQDLFDFIFMDIEAFLILDASGAEFTVNYKDGTKEEVRYDDGFNHYNGFAFPVLAGQVENTVVEGENEAAIVVMGVEVPFTVEVKKDAYTPDENTDVKPDVKPAETQKPAVPPVDVEIPKTGNTVASSVMGAVALVSAIGAAYVLSKKEK